MYKCSYIIYIYNNEKTIPRVIDSLQKLNDGFFREFIVIDDGSTDGSLATLKQCITTLPKATIITQEHIGPTLSIHKALGLAHGDYIHFVDGASSLTPNSTKKLIECCQTMNCDAVFGNYTGTKAIAIASPTKEILENTIPLLRTIGLAGSLVNYNLLTQIKGIDGGIYTHNMSLSLECSIHTHFALCPEQVSVNLNDQHEKIDIAFEIYNNLLATYNFSKIHQDIIPTYARSLLFMLYKEVPSIRAKAFYLFKYFMLKFFKTPTIEDILNYYKYEIDKLF